MANIDSVSDGDFTSLEEVEGVVPEFPFLDRQTPDGFMRIHNRVFEVDRRSYVPRPYIYGGVGYPRLYVRTNFFKYSSDFTNAAWTKINAAISGGGVPNPWDGQSPVYTVGDSGATASHYITQATSSVLVIGAAGMVWAIVSGDNDLGFSGNLGRRYCALQADDGVTFPTCYFDLVSMRVGTASGGAVGGIRDLGDGWRMIWISFVVTATAMAGSFYLADGDGAASFAPVANTGIAVAHMQFESDSINPGHTMLPSPTVPGARIYTTSSYTTYFYPLLDTEDPFAFLLTEGKPVAIGGDIIQIMRRFGRVPAPQISYEYQDLSRPVMHDIVVSGRYAVTFDDGRTSHVFSSRQAVSTWGGLVANTKDRAGTVDETGTINRTGNVDRSGTVDRDKQALTPNSLPASNITVYNDAGSSQTFAANSSKTTIDSAMSTLSITARVFIGTNKLTIQVVTGSTKYIKAVTCADTSVAIDPTGDGGFVATRMQTGSYADTQDTHGTSDDYATVDARLLSANHNLTDTYYPPDSLRTVGVTTHGGAVGDRVVMWGGAKVLGTSIVIVVPNANTFSIPLKDFPGKDDVVTHIQFAKNGTRYMNGTKSIKHKITDDFWLIPSYNNAYNTVADIPTFQKQTDAITWLGLIAAATTTAVVDCVGASSFMGPLVTRRKVEVLMADALDTVSASA